MKYASITEVRAGDMVQKTVRFRKGALKDSLFEDKIYSGYVITPCADNSVLIFWWDPPRIENEQLDVVDIVWRMG